ncbi:MAG: diguanylate cyclase [Firmicutes bacterium]|nr:diguanylate cyclase [Bacillota bacterium]
MKISNQIDIRKRILLPVVTVSLIGVLLTVLQSVYLIQNQENETLRQAIYHTKHILQEGFEEEETKLLPETSFLASDPSIRDALERRDIGTLTSKLIPVKVTFNVDTVEIIDYDGSELLQIGIDAPTHQILIDAGFDLERVCLFARSGDSIWMTAVAPVRSQSGKLLGIILVGDKIDRQFMKNLKEKTGMEIAINYNDLFVGSSIMAEDIALKHSFKEEIQKKEGFAIENSSLYNVTCAADRMEIKTNGGNKVTSYILASTLNANRTKKQGTIAILAINLLVLSIMTIIAYFFSSKIIKPLKIMSDRARLIASGNYKQRIDYTNIREIDELATSFNIMSEALEENRQRLEERAYTDSLTGLYNHRFFQDCLANEITRAERYKHPLSLIILDIDDFKKVNDTFGHTKGDDALKVLTEKILDSIRGIDIACRIGGEEFAIILPETTSYEAFTVAERLRLSVAACAIQDIGKITISIGIATYPDHGASKDSLLEAADTAMYHAKRQGKNLTFMYNGEPLITMDLEDKRLTEESYFMDILHALIANVESKNQYTHNHSEHVAMLAGLIGREIGLNPTQIEDLRIAGLLHDVGKIAIPAFILQKTEPLTEEEFKELRTHPIIGERILSTLTKANLQPVIEAVLYHHERLDGSGYPQGLVKHKIPLYARIIAVADTLDVLVSNSAYRKALSIDEAIIELRRESSTKLDDIVVDALISIMERENAVREIIEKRNQEPKAEPA